ncbi:unnamed protein product [Moneuplotes crassus]|uniref:Uncharacterized protein n=1 Tax=Euplotes crassus TaxID=5936 RepID=A0AAD1UTI1_EUPCR|nr:unnamed protein product [Moneuplotes crassus]
MKFLKFLICSCFGSNKKEHSKQAKSFEQATNPAIISLEKDIQETSEVMSGNKCQDPFKGSKTPERLLSSQNIYICNTNGTEEVELTDSSPKKLRNHFSDSFELTTSDATDLESSQKIELDSSNCFDNLYEGDCIETKQHREFLIKNKKSLLRAINLNIFISEKCQELDLESRIRHKRNANLESNAPLASILEYETYDDLDC